MAVPEPEAVLRTEQEKLDSWRENEFARLGFDEHSVELLVRAEASPHEAHELIRGGCPHATAVAILL